MALADLLYSHLLAAWLLDRGLFYEKDRHYAVFVYSGRLLRAEQLKKEDPVAYDRSLIANIPAILSGLRRGEKKSRRSFEIVEKT